MKFCSKCGTKTENIDKFCQNCGNSLTGYAANKVLSYSLTKKEKLSSLYGYINNLLLLDFFVWMRYAKETGWASLAASLDAEYKAWNMVFAACFIGIIFGITYFFIKFLCIEKCKPTWALTFLALIPVMLILIGLFVGTDTDYPNYNWADWCLESSQIIEILLVFFIWKKAKYDEN
jgi:hypothetical protein